MPIWKKKNDEYVDLSEKLRKRQEQVESFQASEPEEVPATEPASSSSGNGFFGGFFGGGSSSSATPEPATDAAEEKKKKLGKILRDMTSRMESMESEVYQLKQKLEVLEKKQRLGY